MIETRFLKNVVIFIRKMLSFVLSRKFSKRYIIQGILLLKDNFFIELSIFVLALWESPEGLLYVPEVTTNREPSRDVTETSCAGCDVAKSRLDVQLINKMPLEMVIGQYMKEKRHDQNYKLYLHLTFHSHPS